MTTDGSRPEGEPVPDPRDDEQAAWQAIVADLSADTSLVDGGTRLQINDPRLPDAAIDALLAEGPSAQDAFVPPEPPPIPRPRDVIARFAWTGLIGGPALVIATRAAGWDRLLTGLGILAFAAGFVVLVARMGDHGRDTDDDGAVV